MPIVLTVNAGSSSLRLGVYRVNDKSRDCLAKATLERCGNPAGSVRKFLQAHSLPEPDVVVHRIVHGGDVLVRPCLIDDNVEAEIAALLPLAPLHNGAALELIRVCRHFSVQPAQLAVFDTAFFHDLPLVARSVALPAELTARYKLRRYGFHGLAHQAMWHAWASQQPALPEPARVITLQLGSGCSIAAILDGKPMDTSMGFTPLEGLVMATRAGDLDPGLILHIQRELGLDLPALETLLSTQSGLLGVSGVSADMRMLLQSDTVPAREAIALYCYRAAKYIGAYLAVLNGADAIVFGGGVGENSPLIRARILQQLKWAGVHLDPAANDAASAAPRCISTAWSSMALWVLPVDEAGVMLDQASALLGGPVISAE